MAYFRLSFAGTSCASASAVLSSATIVLGVISISTSPISLGGSSSAFQISKCKRRRDISKRMNERGKGVKEKGESDEKRTDNKDKLELDLASLILIVFAGHLNLLFCFTLLLRISCSKHAITSRILLFSIKSSGSIAARDCEY